MEELKALLTIVELALAIKDMSNEIPAPSADLKDKDRWMTVTIFNQTQFNIIWTGGDYFSSGRFWKAPTNVGPFDSMTFSVCDKNASLLTGCSGGAAFSIQLSNGSTVPFAVGFTNPQIGAIKASVVQPGSAEAGYDEASSSSMSTSTALLQGMDDKGNTINMFFKMASSPGQEAAITITQMQQVQAAAA
jgi:hypothetical protein